MYEKKEKHYFPDELEVGDCWIGASLDKKNGLIVTTRVGKHIDQCLAEVVTNTEGKMGCKHWDTDVWRGYKRILPPEMIHIIGKQYSAIGTHQRHHSPADSSMASTTKQIWQAVGTVQSHNSISR